MNRSLFKTLKAVGAAFAFTLPLQIGGAAMVFPTEVSAKTKAPAALPEPYLSKALGAVLIPINAEVRKAFKLKKKKEGVLILAVQPGGLAAKKGLKVGDVIDNVKKGNATSSTGKKTKAKAGKKGKGKKIRKPADLDAAILYWLNNGCDGFYFVGSSDGVYFNRYSVITYDMYYYPYDLASIYAWDNTWYGSDYAYSEYSYSYSEYITTYSSQITETYTSSDTYMSEVLSSSEFSSEMSFSEEVLTEEALYAEQTVNEDYAEDVEENRTLEEEAVETGDTSFIETAAEESYDAEPAAEFTDEAVTEETTDEAPTEFVDETATEEPPEEEFIDEAVADEALTEEPTGEEFTDEAPVEEEMTEEPLAEEYTEEPAAEEYTEEPVAEEYTEEPVAEEPAYEEPAYEEPAYEEPAYEEPAYEEPAYEEPAAEECYDPELCPQ